MNQEVILQISPLGKLGHFESAAEIFLVFIASISLASGPILSITSWYAKVLHVLVLQGGGVVGRGEETEVRLGRGGRVTLGDRA